jgi:hypothetical protein
VWPCPQIGVVRAERWVSKPSCIYPACIGHARVYPAWFTLHVFTLLSHRQDQRDHAIGYVHFRALPITTRGSLAITDGSLAIPQVVPSPIHSNYFEDAALQIVRVRAA